MLQKTATGHSIQTLLSAVLFLAVHVDVHRSTCSTISIDYVLLGNVTIQPADGAFCATSVRIIHVFDQADPCRMVPRDFEPGPSRAKMLD
jgi:hypothetical protein